jgi:hypothetical protein
LGPDGRIFVTRADGQYFSTNPKNIAVESELYTRFDESTNKDRSIEEWFSQEIESPFSRAFDEIVSLNGLRRERFRADPNKRKVVQALGYIATEYRDFILLEEANRIALANYMAALLVRHPKYLAKLHEFHSAEASQSGSSIERDVVLGNMFYVYNIYRQAILKSTITLTKRHGAHEFLFSDGGISAVEPWRGVLVPFDIHFPLTPDLAAAVIPLPFDAEPERIYVAYARDQAVHRQNRISLADARRFIFSRGEPPTSFIRKHFGKPAPKAYGYRVVEGKFETTYDPSRDH